MAKKIRHSQGQPTGKGQIQTVDTEPDRMEISKITIHRVIYAGRQVIQRVDEIEIVEGISSSHDVTVDISDLTMYMQDGDTKVQFTVKGAIPGP